MKNEKPLKGKLGRESTHSASFKVQVALEYINGDYSQKQVEKKYGLSKKSVYRFVAWYNQNQNAIMQEESLIPEQSPINPKDQKAMEKKLALAEMKIAALEKVIAIANLEYGTDLKKKAVSK